MYLFGVPKTENPINDYLVMCNVENRAFGAEQEVTLLTSTKLRKHLATITQTLKLDKTEFKQLTKFIGHSKRTHSLFYRLLNDIFQTTKVSKLLILSKTGNISI